MVTSNKSPFPRTPSPSLDFLLTPDDVSRLLGWSKPTVYSAVSRRRLPFVKIGRSVRFRRADLERIIKAGFHPALNGPAAGPLAETTAAEGGR